MTFRLGRVLAATGAAAAIVIGLAACTGSVPKADVASSISTQLTAKNIKAENVNCPADLVAEVGQSVRCEFVVDGQPVDAIAKVTSINGSTANFDITTEARPVSKALLERKIGTEIGTQTGATIASTVCDGDLQPQVGQKVGCAVTAQGEPEVLKLDVTVTAVDGGAINYAWAPRT